MTSPPEAALHLTIGNEAVASEATFPVINPATEDVLANAPAASRVHLQAAEAAAVGARPEWENDEERRRERLRLCARKIREHAKELSTLLTQEQGKPRRMAMQEIMAASACFREAGDWEGEADWESVKSRARLRRAPVGTVAAIAPWNFPAILAAWHVAPALRAGNTVILKPSPFTPLTTLYLGSILSEVLPRGVLNTLSGGHDLGQWMVESSHVDMVAFTGSIETGRRVAESAARSLKKTLLELGGNDAAIVLDGDPQAMAQALFHGAFDNNGQMCMAIKRLYVHAPLVETLTQALAEICESVQIGDGMDSASQLGPLNNRAHLEKIQNLVDDALVNGGQVRAGGQRLDRPGWFFPPTLVTGVSEGTTLVDGEQFGPLLPILPFDHIDEAIERANATKFGLGGSIWTSDVERGTLLARQLHCGVAWVNQHGVLPGDFPVGGLKQSGLGSSQGDWGYREFSQVRVVSVRES